MHEQIGRIVSRAALRWLGPTLVLGAVACVALVVLSLALTGGFVFESAAAPGEPEHVSPYFGGVVGALLATGLVTVWQAFEVVRDTSSPGTYNDR